MTTIPRWKRSLFVGFVFELASYGCVHFGQAGKTTLGWFGMLLHLPAVGFLSILNSVVGGHPGRSLGLALVVGMQFFFWCGFAWVLYRYLLDDSLPEATTDETTVTPPTK